MATKKKANNRKTFTLLSVCFSRVQRPALDGNNRNLRFLCTDGEKEFFVSPSDMELVDRLNEEEWLAAHDTSNRRDPVERLVVTGFEYDPIQDVPVRIDFSDALETPLRWPVVTAQLDWETLGCLVSQCHAAQAKQAAAVKQTGKAVRRGK